MTDHITSTEEFYRAIDVPPEYADEAYVYRQAYMHGYHGIARRGYGSRRKTFATTAGYAAGRKHAEQEAS